MSQENQQAKDLEHQLTDFDSDFSPEHPTNQEAAQQRGLVYNPDNESYLDEDGCLIKDKFGQPY
jgi:hypothetical protein